MHAIKITGIVNTKKYCRKKSKNFSLCMNAAMFIFAQILIIATKMIDYDRHFQIFPQNANIQVLDVST